MPERKCTMTEYILIGAWATYTILSLIFIHSNANVIAHVYLAAWFLYRAIEELHKKG